MDLRSIDPEDLLTTSEAARLAGVEPGTVRSWAHRGLLTPIPLGDDGPPLYLHLDVARVEKATRARAARRAA